jgi:hypothetical protein
MHIYIRLEASCMCLLPDMGGADWQTHSAPVESLNINLHHYEELSRIGIWRDELTMEIFRRHQSINQRVNPRVASAISHHIYI